MPAVCENSQIQAKSGIVVLATAMLSLFAISGGGCAPKQYAEQADKVAYRTVGKGQVVALGSSREFGITYNPYGNEREDYHKPIRLGDKLIPVGEEGDPVVLTLAECLQLAFRNSRDLQDQKEALFIAALALANAQRGWDIPLLGGELIGDAEAEGANDSSNQYSASAGIGPTLMQRFYNGGVLTLAATLSWATDFLGGGNGTNVTNSFFDANFTQPLLRGAWQGLAYEEQYRLERDFLFKVFSYQRFRQTFSSEVFTNYFNVLELRDLLENDKIHIVNLQKTLALTTVLVQGGQVSRIEEDQAEQDLLSAQVRYLSNMRSYQDALDRFKIRMGIPVEARVELNYPEALERMTQTGLEPLPFEESEAIEIAFSTRPDVLSEQAQTRDALRDIEIAADRFLPQFDVVLNFDARNTDSRDVRWERYSRFAGVTFQYDLDQTDNRDAYRDAQIYYSRRLRDLEKFLDNVRLDVRASYRELIQSQKSYELQLRNVAVAKRRTMLASLQQGEGMASARDVLEAEEGLRSAQNGLTRALIGHSTTRIRFLATLGMFEVDERGMLHEQKEPITFGRIRQRYPYLGTGYRFDPKQSAEPEKENRPLW